MQRNKLLSCIILSFIGLLSFNSLLKAEVSADSPTCTQENLRKYRSEKFQSQMRAKEFGKAAEGLKTFLEESQCWAALIDGLYSTAFMTDKDLTPQELGKVEEYLWARSDLALSYLKDNKPGSCLEIVKTEINQFNLNPLNLSKNKKLEQAFAQNEALCEAKRKELFPEVKVEKCNLANLPKKVSYPGLGEEGLPVDLIVHSVGDSIKLPTKGDFDCIAVINLSIMRGLLEGVCDSEQSCLDTDRDIIEFSALYGLVTSNPAKAQFLDYTNDMGWCGEPEISIHSEALKGTEAIANIVRVSSSISPCISGSGRAEVDTYFVINAEKLEPMDACLAAYH